MKKLYTALLFALPLLAGANDKIFPSGALSINLERCQFHKAIGASEHLDPSSFSFLKNNRFAESGKYWKSSKVKFTAGKAAFSQGSFIKHGCSIPETVENTRFEAQIDVKGSGTLAVTLRSLDKNGKLTRPAKTQRFKLKGAKTTLRSQILAFPGSTALGIEVKQISGSSVITRTDLTRSANLQWVAARCLPAAITDNVFALMENTPLPINFPYRNLRRGKDSHPGFITLVLDAPAGFSFSPGSQITKVSETRKNNRVIWKFRCKPHALSAGYLVYQSFNMLAATALKASNRIYHAEYHLEYAGVKTLSYPLKFRVIPAVKARRPAHFRTGFIASSECNFSGSSANKFITSVSKLGFNMIHHDTHPQWKDISAVSGKHGILRTVTDYWFNNGYVLGYGKQPENTKFIGRDGKPLKFNSWHRYLCPAAAYNRSEFFNKNVIGYFGEKVMKYDFGSFLKVNWEPLAFDDKGCFCQNCREDFIKYSKIPRNTVIKAWPKDMTGKYRSIWVKFRAWQHAKMIGAIVDGMKELSKKYNREFVFCPEVGFGDLTGSKFYEQYTVREYLHKLKWLNPWGPYIFHSANSNYQYNIAFNYGTYAAAKLGKQLLRKVSKDGNVPKIEAFPHGYQCFTWVTSPEALAYETAAFFINGWEASSAYVFPAGLDARYWSALAGINHAISYVDTFVFKGKRRNDLTMEHASPVPNPMAVYDLNNPVLAAMAEELRKHSPVTIDAYEYQGKTLVALGNAWQRGEAFVKVKIPGLDKKKKYAVAVPARNAVLAKDYTASELANGILLHVSALNFSFYIVEPVQKGKNYGTVVGKNGLAKLMKQRITAIRKVFNADKAYAAEFVAVSSYDFAQTPSLAAGTVSVKPQKSLTDSVLQVKTPYYSCALDMGNGGVVTDLIYKGKKLVSEKHGMFRDALVIPGPVTFNRSYDFVSWESSGEGAIVTLRYTLGAKDPGALRKLQIVKRYIFGEKKIGLQLELINRSGKTLEFTYRSHNIPTCFDRNGSLQVGKTSLKRLQTHIFHPFPGSSGPVFDSQSGVGLRGSKAVFKGKNGTLVLQWKMPLSGIYRWDSAKSSISSFELISKKTVLKNNNKLQAEFTLTCGK